MEKIIIKGDEVLVHKSLLQGDANARYSFKKLTIGNPFENNKNSTVSWSVNLTYEDIIICTVYGIDKMEALDNASRMTQAINMHDELVKELKSKIETFWGANEEKHRESFRRDYPVHSINKSEQLLKQAE